MNLALLGLPYDHNSSFLSGAALAPSRIRQMAKDGASNSFSETGKDVSQLYADLNDVEFSSTNPLASFTTISKSVNNILTNFDKLLSLGGDHSITYPIVYSFSKKYPELSILHIDAHPDLYANFDDNIYSHASPFARIMENGLATHITQVGLRTLNAHQKEQALRFNIEQIEMKDFNFDFLTKLKGPLYLSIDLDGLDPAFAPGVSHHEPGGLSTRELIRIIHEIPVPIVGADIVELNPARDFNNMTAMVAYKIMKELISKMTDIVQVIS